MDAPSVKRSPPAPGRESGVVQRVRQSLGRGIFEEADRPRILVACSGGRDSVALAAVLSALNRSGTIDLEMVHVDHGVRSASHDAAEGTRVIAEQVGIPFHLVTLQRSAIENHGGVGPEEALRRERYQAINGVALRIHADAVAVAHHERDQAETVLLHLIRGAGLHGATGMREWTTIDVPWWSCSVHPRAMTLWRPFLRESYDDIESIATSEGFAVFEDESNQNRLYRRNAIRHDVLPVLEQIAPGAASNIARFAELAGQDDDVLDRIAERRLHLQPDRDLHRRAVIDQPVAIQRRVIQRWVAVAGFSGDITTNRIDAIVELATRNRSGAQVDLGAGWIVRIEQGVLSLQTGAVHTHATMQAHERRALNDPVKGMLHGGPNK